MARPKNQADKRRELMDAAQRAIATRGLGALRLRDVADEAGITGPAVSYYYPDIDDLLVDVYNRAIHHAIERGPDAIADISDPWEQIQALMAGDMATGPDDVDSSVMYQYAGEPRFSRTYGAMSAALHSSQQGLYRSVIDRGLCLGRFESDLDAAVAARAIIALCDAYGLQVVVAEPGVTQASALAELSMIAASILRVSKD